jgi:hypothetical protein
MNRRKFLSFGALAAATTALAACTTLRDGTKTTLTLDVSKINSYGQAGLNAAETIAAALAFIPAVSPYIATVTTIAELLKSDLAKFAASTSGKITVVYDDSSVKTIVDSVSTDLSHLLDAIKQAAASAIAAKAGVTQNTQNQISLIGNALSTIVSVFEAMLGTVSTGSASSAKMSEADALNVLGVR